MQAEPAAKLRRRLADQLEGEGELRSPAWRRAVETVPREVFIGGRIYRRTGPAGGTSWDVVTRATLGPADWLALVYQDETWVTQIAGDDHGDPAEGAPSSSSTLPSLVVRMLEDLDVSDGNTVLEIGTGTGYSTALMCHRLGDANVTSIEIDPDVAVRARAALTTAGYRPALVCGDGLAGDPAHAPYDRIIATCSVRAIPAPWLDQCRPGGRILTTLSGWLYGSGYVNLEVTAPGHAHGHFMPGTVSFMTARPHAAPLLTELPAREGTGRTTSIGADLLTDWMGLFLAQLALPTACRATVIDDDGRPAHVIVDMNTRAYAWLQQRDSGDWTIIEGGPSSVWRTVEQTVEAWHKAGRPDQQHFTLAITPETQTVHLKTDGQDLSWPLPSSTP
ncbi:MAG TPA: ATP-grasp peptide maturase system methyltransferase [Streptosporangiaceae bacterium]|jgi:methyltransferase of ATP-grasp peptide maturase system